MEKTKTIKVASILKKDREIPLLKMSGNWLDAIGLKVGTNLKVYKGKDILLLVKEN